VVVQEEVLGVAHRGEGTADIGGDGLQDDDVHEGALLTASGEGDDGERDEGDEGHIVGDEHRGEEGQGHQGEGNPSKIGGDGEQCVGEGLEHAVMFKPRDDEHQGEEHGNGLPIDRGGVQGTGRNHDHGGEGEEYGDDEHRLLLQQTIHPPLLHPLPPPAAVSIPDFGQDWQSEVLFLSFLGQGVV